MADRPPAVTRATPEVRIIHQREPWPAGHAYPSPGPDGIIVFDFSLLPGQARVHALLPHLDAGEHERANRFATPALRELFIVAHGQTREILAGLLGTKPEDLRFVYGREGKPCLPELAALALEFNLTHTSDRALLAVARGRRVGVDLERLRPMPDALDLATRYFHPKEIQALCQQDPVTRAAAFLSAWTRKESYVKAVGGGLSLPLSDFHAEPGPGQIRRWVADGNSRDKCAWFVGDLAVGDDHVAAVTFSSPG